MEIFIAIILILIWIFTISFVAGDASKNKMDPWVWGIMALIMGVYSLPLYFIFRWLNRGKLISHEVFERRRVQILQFSLILLIISIVFVVLSTFTDSNTYEEKIARGKLLLFGLSIGVPCAICVVVLYTSKQSELISNQTNNITNQNKVNLERSSFCKNCGKQVIDSNAKFCESCGGKL